MANETGRLSSIAEIITNVGIAEALVVTIDVIISIDIVNIVIQVIVVQKGIEGDIMIGIRKDKVNLLVITDPVVKRNR